MSLQPSLSNLHIATYSDPTAFDELRSSWNELVQRSTANTVFSLWEWHRNWWMAYQPGELWLITVLDEAEQLVGIASCFIEQTAQGRTLRFVGSEDVTDYLDLIVDVELQNDVLSHLARTFASYGDRFDAIGFVNIPQASPTLTHFITELEALGYTTQITQHEVCPILQLPTSFDGYFELLDGKQARELRRKQRIAAEFGDSVQWYIVQKQHDINAEIDKFLRLMESSHPEKAAFLESAQHVAFFRTMMPDLMRLGYLQLNFLTVNDEPVAAYLNFDYAGHIGVYNSGLEPRKYANLSPGIILLLHNIRHAIEQGRKVFDFLRGNENYKYRMGASDSPIYRLEAQART